MEGPHLLHVEPLAGTHTSEPSCHIDTAYTPSQGLRQVAALLADLPSPHRVVQLCPPQCESYVAAKNAPGINFAAHPDQLRIICRQVPATLIGQTFMYAGTPLPMLDS